MRESRSGKPDKTMKLDWRLRARPARAKFPPPLDSGMERARSDSRLGLSMLEEEVQKRGGGPRHIPTTEVSIRVDGTDRMGDGVP